MLPIIKNKTKALIDYFLGRVFPMFSKPGLYWCSRYMTFMGRIILRTPMFTENELKEAKRKANDAIKAGGKPDASLDHLGLGPVPEYMRDELYNWKTDRTVEDTVEHINGAILMSIYRNKSYRDMSLRVAVISLVFCTAIAMLDAGAWALTGAVSSVGHRLANAWHGKSGPSIPSDDTDEVIPSNVRDAIAAAMTAKPPLTADEQAFAVDTDNCAPFLADIIDTNAAKATQAITTATVMYEVGQKMAGCRKSGFAYHADLVSTLKPFKDTYGKDEHGKWLRLLSATTLPGTWTPSRDFSTCDATLKQLATAGASVGPSGFLLVHSAADCINNGSSIPAPTSAAQD
jgi:hypothetical protein